MLSFKSGSIILSALLSRGCLAVVKTVLVSHIGSDIDAPFRAEHSAIPFPHLDQL